MECGTCTICCDLFEVPVLDKPAFVSCVHCDNGCTIHDTKPDFCRSFDCAYAQMDSAHESLRPDVSGVIYEKVSDDIFYGFMDHRRINYPHLKGQVDSFIAQGFSVVLFHKDRGYKAVVADGISEQSILEEFKSIIGARHGLHL